MAGVVHEHIQAPDLLPDGGEGFGHVVLASHVEGDRQIAVAVAVKRFDHLFHLLGRAAVDEDGGPIGGEDSGNAGTGVAGGTGYENIFALEHGWISSELVVKLGSE